MIDIRKLKELVRLMVENDLSEVDLRDSEEQVTLRRPGRHQVESHSAIPASVTHAAPVSRPASEAPAPKADLAAPTDDGLLQIASPMVGTFYASPDPDAAPFVSVGTSVGDETVVCLIEAMKIFNEIKAECAGTIERVLVKNGQAVEFGQPLFLVRPA